MVGRSALGIPPAHPAVLLAPLLYPKLSPAPLVRLAPVATFQSESNTARHRVGRAGAIKTVAALVSRSSVLVESKWSPSEGRAGRRPLPHHHHAPPQLSTGFCGSPQAPC